MKAKIYADEGYEFAPDVLDEFDGASLSSDKKVLTLEEFNNFDSFQVEAYRNICRFKEVPTNRISIRLRKDCVQWISSQLSGLNLVDFVDILLEIGELRDGIIVNALFVDISTLAHVDPKFKVSNIMVKINNQLYLPQELFEVID